MVWIYNSEKPQPVETRINLGRKQRTINYLIEPTSEGGYAWRYLSVTLEPGIWHYGAIVDAIVSAEYPLDRMQAVQNNYLLNPTWDDALEEMEEMQNWRKYAKRVAEEMLAIVPAV